MLPTAQKTTEEKDREFDYVKHTVEIEQEEPITNSFETKYPNRRREKTIPSLDAW
jgi:hypothetical protein